MRQTIMMLSIVGDNENEKNNKGLLRMCEIVQKMLSFETTHSLSIKIGYRCSTVIRLVHREIALLIDRLVAKLFNSCLCSIHLAT